MIVKILKLHRDAVIPSYANPTDGGLDLTATEVNLTEDYIEYGTGLAMEIPEGHVGLLFPRSSNSKKALLLCNSVGVVDPAYRGEIKLRYKKVAKGSEYSIGDKVAQLIIIPFPAIQFEEVYALAESVRGDNGFGSTGQ